MSATATAYLHQATNYVPSMKRIVSFLPGGGGASGSTGGSASEVPRTVIWRAFERHLVRSRPGQQGDTIHLYLVLGLIDGFQIYRVHSPDDVRQVVSFPDGPIASVRFLPDMYQPPDAARQARASSESDMLDSTSQLTAAAAGSGAGMMQQSTVSLGPSGSPDPGLLLAVSSADDRSTFPSTRVKIFSVEQSKYIHMLRFRSRVHGLYTGATVLAVVLENEIHVYSARYPHFPFLFSTRCYPNPAGYGVCALGARWIAYAAAEPVPPQHHVMAGAKQIRSPSLVPTTPAGMESAALTGISTGPSSAFTLPPPSVTAGSGYAVYASSIGSLLSSASAAVSAGAASLSVGLGLSGSGNGGAGAPGGNGAGMAPVAGSGDAASGGGAAGGAVSASALAQMASVGKDLATDLATGLYTLGDMGRRKMSTVLSGAIPAVTGSLGVGDIVGVSAGGASGASTPVIGSSGAGGGNLLPAGADRDMASHLASCAGTVIVRDIRRQRVIAHFQAHTSPISCMQFDASGMLLATAPDNGQYLHVYQIVAVYNNMSHAEQAAAAVLGMAGNVVATSGQVGIPSDSTSPVITSPTAGAFGVSSSSTAMPSVAPAAVVVPVVYVTRQLYRLHRGITHALVRSLSFSSDSTLLAATSQRGTTHVFTILPQGGSVSLQTHGPVSTHSAGTASYIHPFELPETITLDAVHRLKPSESASAEASAAPNPAAYRLPPGLSGAAYAYYTPVVAAFFPLRAPASSSSGRHGVTELGAKGAQQSQLPQLLSSTTEREFDQLASMGALTAGGERLWIHALRSRGALPPAASTVSTASAYALAAPGQIMSALANVAAMVSGSNSGTGGGAASAAGDKQQVTAVKKGKQQNVDSDQAAAASTVSSAAAGAHGPASGTASSTQRPSWQTLEFDTAELSTWDLSHVRAAGNVSPHMGMLADDSLAGGAELSPRLAGPRGGPQLGSARDLSPGTSPRLQGFVGHPPSPFSIHNLPVDVQNAIRTRWLANVETQTFQPNPAQPPLWARPQFILRVYDHDSTGAAHAAAEVPLESKTGRPVAGRTAAASSAASRVNSGDVLNRLLLDDEGSTPLKYNKFHYFAGMHRTGDADEEADAKFSSDGYGGGALDDNDIGGMPLMSPASTHVHSGAGAARAPVTVLSSLRGGRSGQAQQPVGLRHQNAAMISADIQHALAEALPDRAYDADEQAALRAPEVGVFRDDSDRVPSDSEDGAAAGWLASGRSKARSPSEPAELRVPGSSVTGHDVPVLQHYYGVKASANANAPVSTSAKIDPKAKSEPHRRRPSSPPLADDWDMPEAPTTGLLAEPANLVRDHFGGPAGPTSAGGFAVSSGGGAGASASAQLAQQQRFGSPPTGGMLGGLSSSVSSTGSLPAELMQGSTLGPQNLFQFDFGGTVGSRASPARSTGPAAASMLGAGIGTMPQSTSGSRYGLSVVPGSGHHVTGSAGLDEWDNGDVMASSPSGLMQNMGFDTTTLSRHTSSSSLSTSPVVVSPSSMATHALARDERRRSLLHSPTISSGTTAAAGTVSDGAANSGSTRTPATSLRAELGASAGLPPTHPKPFARPPELPLGSDEDAFERKSPATAAAPATTPSRSPVTSSSTTPAAAAAATRPVLSEYVDPAAQHAGSGMSKRHPSSSSSAVTASTVTASTSASSLSSTGAPKKSFASAVGGAAGVSIAANPSQPTAVTSKAAVQSADSTKTSSSAQTKAGGTARDSTQAASSSRTISAARTDSSSAKVTTGATPPGGAHLPASVDKRSFPAADPFAGLDFEIRAASPPSTATAAATTGTNTSAGATAKASPSNAKLKSLLSTSARSPPPADSGSSSADGVEAKGTASPVKAKKIVHRVPLSSIDDDQDTDSAVAAPGGPSFAAMVAGTGSAAAAAARSAAGKKPSDAASKARPGSGGGSSGGTTRPIAKLNPIALPDDHAIDDVSPPIANNSARGKGGAQAGKAKK